jgi:gluconokinase
VRSRENHFMPVSLVQSQLAALERPDAEHDVLTISAEQPIEAVLANALKVLQMGGNT